MNVTCATPPEVCDDPDVTVFIDFDDFQAETSWEIAEDVSGTVVASGDDYTTEDILNQGVCLDDGCYTFTINDSFGDGICCGFGLGSYTVTGPAGVIATGGEFGSSETSAVFCIGAGGREASPDWSLYPNPATNGEVELDLTNYLNTDLEIQMIDYSGKVLINKAESNLQNPRYRMNTQNASSGLYFVRIVTNSGVSVKKLIIAN